MKRVYFANCPGNELPCSSDELDRMTDQEIKIAYSHVSWVLKPDWKIKADYQFINRIPGFALAWQFLQRLPEYRVWQCPLSEMISLSCVLPMEIRKELGLERILPERPTMRFRQETVSDPLIQADSVQKDFTGFLNRISKSDVLRHRNEYIGVYQEVCIDTAREAFQEKWGVSAPWPPGAEQGKLDEFNPFLPLTPPSGQANRKSIIETLRLLDAQSEGVKENEIWHFLLPHSSARDCQIKRYTRKGAIQAYSDKGYLGWLNSPPK